MEAEDQTRERRRRQAKSEALWLVACGAAMASSGFRREFFSAVQRQWAPSDAIGGLATQLDADSREGVKAKLLEMFSLPNVPEQSALQAIVAAIVTMSVSEEVTKMKARIGYESKSPREFLGRLLHEARALAAAIPDGDKLVAGSIPTLIEGPEPEVKKQMEGKK